MKKDSKDSRTREYKRNTFSRLLDDLIRERWNGSNESFANKMNEIYERDGIMSPRRKDEFRTCTHQQVQKWRKEGVNP